MATPPPFSRAPAAVEQQLSALAGRVRERLRARMRATRRVLGEAVVATRSERICAALLQLNALQRARSVALFWPRVSQREVDLRGLDRELRARGASLYYPFMDPKERGFTTGFRRVDRVAELLPRGRGFAEPSVDAPAALPGEIDVVIVPALAVTPEGHRLGYGSGFYDVTLPEFRPPALAVIVAYSFQLLCELPVLEHDVACDLIVTDREVYDASSAATPDPNT